MSPLGTSLAGPSARLEQISHLMVGSDRIAQDACALLNGRGGRITIEAGGSDPSADTPDIDTAARQLVSTLATITPPALAIPRPLAPDAPTLIIDVPRGTRPPYMIDGTIFVRKHGRTVTAAADDLSGLIVNRTLFDSLWEQQPAMGLTIDGLDIDEIHRSARDARIAGPVVPLDDIHGALRAFNLLVDDQPTQAAVVAFARQPLPWYPQCTLRLARFRGTAKGEFLDQQRATGHAFHLLQHADHFIRKHVPVAGTFVSSAMVRQDRPLYPPLALREALVNAFCHRDYSVVGGSVSVAIFDDRLEIASTGGLPEGLTPDDLKRDHPSIPRNPLLAQLFYQRGLIELWGRGTLSMIALCEADGGVAPVFESRGGEMLVRFFAPGAVQAVSGLSDRQNRILSALGQAPRMPLRDLRTVIGSDQSDQTIRNDLIALRGLGLVESQGQGRGATWRLVRIAPRAE